MMKPVENSSPDDLPPRHFWWQRNGQWFGNLLVNPLMRAEVIEEADVIIDHPSRMSLAEDQNVVQTFTPKTAQETLTNRIGSRSLEGRVEQFNVSAGDSSFK